MRIGRFVSLSIIAKAKGTLTRSRMNRASCGVALSGPPLGRSVVIDAGVAHDARATLVMIVRLVLQNTLRMEAHGPGPPVKRDPGCRRGCTRHSNLTAKFSNEDVYH